jgi:hypothetical protein
MSERKVYHVVPNGDQGWRLKVEGAQRATSRHQTKEEAIQKGRALASKEPLGQVIIHKRDGTIEGEYTYGKDPFPPRG